MEQLKYVEPNELIAGLDFSTGSVKGLLLTPTGETVAEVKYPAEQLGTDGVREMSITELAKQAKTVIVDLGRWLAKNPKSRLAACGISATHHTAGRIDAANHEVRRMICWNDQTLAKYHAEGLVRIGGPARVQELLGGPWAERYSLSHLVKDESTLSAADWHRTRWMLLHGPLAAGYLTGRFGVTSISSAASTGIMDFRTNTWCKAMLDAIANAEYRELAWNNLPAIIDQFEPIGPLAESYRADATLGDGPLPLVFPTLDDQAAGLIGGGATEAGHVAIILGNSAVVNSSALNAPKSGSLDAMKLNWGPYLWMRCYSNGAQFLDNIVGKSPDWAALEAAARAVPVGCGGVRVSPFVLSEPSIGVGAPRPGWTPHEPTEPGVRLRAAFEALASLIALAVEEHEAAGQTIRRVSVSGGIARNDLMLEILASMLNRPLERLVSDEGSALGGAVVALSGLETVRRRDAGNTTAFSATDAMASMVKFKESMPPNPQWVAAYSTQLREFAKGIKG